MRRLLVLALVAVVAGGGWVVLRRWLRPPNVVVIVADTLRADRLGAYGNRRGLTPFLDELAARGTVFTHAYAASSWTCPSVASLLTSRYPTQHHVTDFDSKVPDAEVTLAERLRDRRYLSVGFSANWRLTEALGYGQGFEHFSAFVSGRKVTTAQLTRKSVRWLDRGWSRWARKPVFLYYQLMEMHAPYDPAGEARGTRADETALRRRLGILPEDAARTRELNGRLTGFRWKELMPGDTTFLESLYDVEAAMLDLRLRRLFAELERRGVLERAVVVFTADHGEEFRDHGQLAHGTSLFNELIHVPLIVLTPGDAGGRVVDENVSLVDLAPTILDLVGVRAEPRFEGRSLRPALAGAPEARDVVAELPPTAGQLDLGRHTFAFLRGPVKVIGPRGDAAPEVYDLGADPWEEHADPPGLASATPGYVADARGVLTALASRGTRAERGTVDEATRARLRALGYAN